MLAQKRATGLSSEMSMPTQLKRRTSRRTAANTDAGAKHRRWFSLRAWTRRSGEPDDRDNVRAGGEVRRGYPFELRF